MDITATVWTLLPPIIAIALALITKEVYSSLLIGILAGALLYTGFNPLHAVETTFEIMGGKLGGNINICIFLVGAFSLSLDIIIASTIMMFISANTLEYVVGLFNHRKLVMIISEKGEEVSEAILASERFGVTLIRGKGAYSGGDREILLTVTNNVALKRLENLVFMVDPKALFVVENTFYVSGGQFSRRN